jgi:hypothetical protein
MRDISADESSQNQHRYLVLGAVTARTEVVPNLVAAIRAARLPALPHDEMKRTKVSAGKLDGSRAVGGTEHTWPGHFGVPTHWWPVSA